MTSEPLSDSQHHILVIAEHFGGKVMPVTYELVTAALKISEQSASPVLIAVIGEDIQGIGEKISAKTGLPVWCWDVAGLANYNSAVYKAAISEMAAQSAADYICIAHTTQGMDFAPGLAVRLTAACISGVEEILTENGELQFTRSLFSNKIVSRLIPRTLPVVLTFQPGIFKYAATQAGGVSDVSLVQKKYDTVSIKHLDYISAGADHSALNQAQVIVSAGRGIGKEENLALIERFGQLFSKSAIACSRPICDMGWLRYQHQVGSTGASVEPRLYIACGISGSTQHLAGMKKAQFIVSINTDPNAAIFNISDVCIVEDVMAFLNAFIEVATK